MKISTLLITLAIPALAQTTYYWDTDAVTPGFGSASGTVGTDPFFTTDATGSSITVGSVLTASDTLRFGEDSVGIGSGTVNINGTLLANNIEFGNASGAVTLTGGTIDFGGGSDVISATTGAVAATATHTINSDISNSGGNLTFGTQVTNNEDYIVNGVISGAGGVTGRTSNFNGSVSLNALNTFTGNFQITTGQVNANTLANAGTASSIGAGSGIILSAGGGQNPVLNYTGLADTSTDRDITLQRGGNNVIIAQEGNLNLSGDITGANTSFDNPLFLSGESANVSSQNEVSGVIGEAAGATTTVTVGTFGPRGGTGERGSWNLSGVNTYTGKTTINNGSVMSLIGSGSIDESEELAILAGGVYGVFSSDSTFGNTVTGQGSVFGNFTAESASGAINPGLDGTGIGTLTFFNDLTVTDATINLTLATALANIPTNPNEVPDASLANALLSPGGQHDAINVSGILDAGAGNINVSFDGGYTEALGDYFDILDFGAGSSIGSISLPSFTTPEFYWDTSRLEADGIIIVAPEPTSSALIGLGILGLLGTRRRKQ